MGVQIIAPNIRVNSLVDLAKYRKASFESASSSRLYSSSQVNRQCTNARTVVCKCLISKPPKKQKHIRVLAFGDEARYSQSSVFLFQLRRAQSVVQTRLTRLVHQQSINTPQACKSRNSGTLHAQGAFSGSQADDFLLPRMHVACESSTISRQGRCFALTGCHEAGYKSYL